jgi:hypothetical protein
VAICAKHGIDEMECDCPQWSEEAQATMRARKIVELLGRIEQLEVFLGEAVAYIENPAAYHSSGEQVARGCRQILEKTNTWA